MSQEQSSLPPGLFNTPVVIISALILAAIIGLVITRTILVSKILTPTPLPIANVTTDPPPVTLPPESSQETSQEETVENSEATVEEGAAGQETPDQPGQTEMVEENNLEETPQATTESPTKETASEEVEETGSTPPTEGPLEEEIVEPAQETPNQPSPRPPSATLVFVQSDKTRHSLGIVSSNGNLALGPDDLLQDAAAPAWSPTRDRIALFLEPAQRPQSEGLWLVDSNGQNLSQVINIDHIKNIVWSPNGDKIAFEENPPQQGLTSRVWVVNAAGQYRQDDPSIIRFDGEQPGWSPDGQKLVIKGCFPSCGLWLVNFDGGGKQQLTTNGTDSYPNWSPDGRYLIFTSEKRDDDWEIYRLRMVGETPQGRPVRLTYQSGDDVTPVFGSGSRVIYFRTSAFGGWRINKMNIDGSNQQMVLEGVGLSNDWGLARPAVR